MRDLSDPISRQQTITALRALSDEDGYINVPHEVVTDVVRGLPPVRAEQGQTIHSERGESDKLASKMGGTMEERQVLISRQQAIDIEGLDAQIRCEMCRNPMHTNRGCDGHCKYDEKLYERIIQILDKRITPSPSAEPERKTGKWDFMGWQMFQCSECKHTFTQDFLEGWREYTYESHFPPFCPNCGADMREGQDERHD